MDWTTIWTTILPLVVFGAAALTGVAVAARLRLFSPPPPAPPGTGAALGASPLFLGALGVFVWLAIVGSAVASLLGVDKDTPATTVARAQLLASAAQVGPALLIGWLACRYAGVHRPTTGFRRLVLQGLGWATLLLPAVFAVGSLASAVSDALGHPVDKAAHSMLKVIAEPGSGAATRWMLIAVAVAAAPVIEETCYRGLLQRGVARVTRSNLAAVLLASAVFASMHVLVIPAGSLWPALMQVFALALVLGFIAARTGSVVPSMVVHAVFNAVSIAVAVWWAVGPDKR